MQEIGRGANGMVYRARHSLLRRPVAVKLLSPDMTNATNAARFEHEVQMTSQLTHPNTVAIYDYGLNAAEVNYLYAQGSTTALNPIPQLVAQQRERFMAMVLVTHDRYLLNRVSSTALGLDGRGHTGRFADYSQWEDWTGKLHF